MMTFLNDDLENVVKVRHSLNQCPAETPMHKRVYVTAHPYLHTASIQG